MPPEVIEVLKTLGLAGVFLMQLQIVYQDGRKDRAEMLALLHDLTTKNEAIETRLERLEKQFDRVVP